MICGFCRQAGLPGVAALQAHWAETGCPQHKPIWARVVAARKAGHSGHRILHEAFPSLWPSDPMTEEAREKLKELAERRKATGVVAVKKFKG